MRDRTSIVIAHRLSTILTADVIVVMERGRVLATGTHKDLLESCPLYNRLYQMQFDDSIR
jgi:subfamily B ATP-binding cassette protein MsbA